LLVLFFTLTEVSMYVAILSSALDDWVTDLRGLDLIEYALLCREELQVVSPPRRVSAYTALAAEIAYDRALIALCTERGIDANATSFSYPRAERQRIETVLRGAGVDPDHALALRTRVRLSSAATVEEPEGTPDEVTHRR
jgi:hypothetical protein